MNQPDPPSTANQQELDAQELLEWRDLQNAQIDSMMHVWDNPEDEVWNDVPLDSSTQVHDRQYVESYPYLTDDQLDLFDRMSEISEDCFCAGWIHDNEYDIWEALVNGDPSPSHRPMSPRLLRRCQLLSRDIGGWIYWANGPQFAPIAQWLAMVDARRKSQGHGDE